MQKIHNLLRTRFAWYARWHEDPHASTVAWCVFVLVALLYATILFNQILETSISIDATYQASVVGGAVFSEPSLNFGPEVGRLISVNNTALLRANEHAFAAPGLSGQKLDALKDALSERKATLKELALTNPEDVRKFIFDENVRNSIPDAARDLIEEPFEEEGTYRMLIAENFTENDIPYEEYFLELAPDERYRLALTEEEAYSIEPNSRVAVRGVKFEDLVLSLEFKESENADTGEVRGASTVKKIAVIAFNFRNNTAEPISTDEIRKRVFTNQNSVAGYYEDASYGQWDIQSRDRVDGDVFGWVTIDADANGSCSFDSWGYLANQAVAAAGGNLSGYTNIQYVFPGANAGCGWAGVAYMGGSTSWVRVEYLNTLVSGHEFGHNFGFHHAGSYGCSVAKTGTGLCTPSEYADPGDIMGNRAARHTNNYNKSKYWIPSSQIQTITSPGTYTLAPLETLTNGVKTLRIKRPFAAGSLTVTDGYYYLEFRTPSGTFDNYSSTDKAVTSLTLRLGNGNYTSGGQKTYWVNSVALGTQFVDAEGGITITPLSITAEGIAVSVDMPQVPCYHYAPTVSMSPYSQSESAGNSTSYSLSVKNNDSEACSASTFTVEPTLPSGFTQSPETPSLLLNPGEQKSMVLAVGSPLVTVAGSYTVAEKVNHDMSLTHSATTYSVFNVVVPDLTPPTIVVNSPVDGTLVTGKKTSVNAQASDPSGILKMQIRIDGKLVKTCNGASSCIYSWNTARVSKGQHLISVISVDNSLQQNQAEVQISVTK